MTDYFSHSFRLVTAPTALPSYEEPVYSSFGAAKMNVAGAIIYDYRSLLGVGNLGPSLLVTALSSGTVGGTTEYDLRVSWSLYTGSVVHESGEFSVGYDYEPGAWVALPSGVRLSFTGAAITADGTATVTIPCEAIGFGPDHEELDLSELIYNPDCDHESETRFIAPEFGVSEYQDSDVVTSKQTGEVLRVARRLERNFWINADAVPVGVRREVLRWIEEGRRVCVFPYFEKETIELWPLQDSTLPYIGHRKRKSYSTTGSAEGDFGCSELASGLWQRSPAGASGAFGNMDPIGRGMINQGITTTGNYFTPSSPTSQSNLGWTIPGTDTGTFDASVQLPIIDDPGALRWEVGAGSTGITNTVAPGAGKPFTFSVFLRGRTGATQEATITCSPASAAIPRNSATVVLTDEWTRVYICGAADGSGNTVLKIEADPNAVVYVCGGQVTPQGLLSSYRTPDGYEPRHTGTYTMRMANEAGASGLIIPADCGTVSFFWQPGCLGGRSTAHKSHAIRSRESNGLEVYIRDTAGDGSAFSICATIAGGTAIEVAVPDYDPEESCFVFFSWTSGGGGSGYSCDLFVYREGKDAVMETGFCGTTTTRFGSGGTGFFDTTVSYYDYPSGRLAMLRLDGDSHVTIAEYDDHYARECFRFWTDPQTKELAKIAFGREFLLSCGANAISGGNPSYIDIPLTLNECRVHESAIYRG